MRKVFADTFYWVALINLRDQWRNRALEVSANLIDAQIVTSDEVLTETLNYFAESIEFLRQKSVEDVQAILLNQNVEIISSRHEVFLDAIELYSLRPDKGYSLTDCISMLIMREFEISEILTHDHHFTQEGFQILL